MAKTAKQARAVRPSSRDGTSSEVPDASPQFSREMALYWLNDIKEQFNDIASVAISGLAYQKTRAEDYKDPVTISLLRVIQEQTNDSVQVGNELRRMLEALPKESSNG